MFNLKPKRRAADARLDAAASSSSSSSSSSSGRSDARAKVYDFERDIVPMCDRIDAEDLPKLRDWLQQLIESGKIGAQPGLTTEQVLSQVRRWSRAKVCQVLRDHFVGLAGQPVVTVDHSSVPPLEPRSNLWRDALLTEPNMVGQFLSVGALQTLESVSKGTRYGTDKIHNVCHAKTKRGTMCMKNLREGRYGNKDDCVHYCTSHLRKVVQEYLDHLMVQGYTLCLGLKMYRRVTASFSIRCPLPGIREQWQVELLFSTNTEHLEWVNSVTREFAQSVGAPPVVVTMGGMDESVTVSQNFAADNMIGVAKFVTEALIHFHEYVYDARLDEWEPKHERTWARESYTLSKRRNDEASEELARLRTLLIQTGVEVPGGADVEPKTIHLSLFSRKPNQRGLWIAR